MDFDNQIQLQHILFLDRQCRCCKEIKSLMDDFYLTRKGRGAFPSSYSYECKECTKKRILKNRKDKKINQFATIKWEYPDW